MHPGTSTSIYNNKIKKIKTDRRILIKPCFMPSQLKDKQELFIKIFPVLTAVLPMFPRIFFFQKQYNV